MVIIKQSPDFYILGHNGRVKKQSIIQIDEIGDEFALLVEIDNQVEVHMITQNPLDDDPFPDIRLYIPYDGLFVLALMPN
jgi:hypothetical protein